MSIACLLFIANDIKRSDDSKTQKVTFEPFPTFLLIEFCNITSALR